MSSVSNPVTFGVSLDGRTSDALGDLRKRVAALERGGGSAGGGTASVADATTVTKGKLQLAGDLGGTASLVEVKNKLDVFNITDAAYGAVPGAPDNTAEIQAALDAIEAAGGGVLWIPPGIFYSSPLTYGGDNLTIMGSGWSSILRQITPAVDVDNEYLFSIDGATNDVALNRRSFAFLNFQMLGRSDLYAFDQAKQHIHLMRLSAVSDVLIQGMLLKGFRGDGLYLQGNDGDPAVAANVRHNERVKVLASTFDGINQENRNAISVIDCDDFLSDDCTFKNCTDPTAPGAIDFEPNPGNTEAILRHCRVTNPHFDNVGGNSAVISVFSFDEAVAEGQITDFRFTGGSMTNCPGLGFYVSQAGHADDSTPRHDVLIDDFYIDGCLEPWEFDGIHGGRVTNSTFVRCPDGPAMGYHTTCRDIRSLGNTYIECGTDSGTVFQLWQCDGFESDDSFHNCGGPPDYAGVANDDYPFGLILWLNTPVASATADATTNFLTLTGPGSTYEYAEGQEINFAVDTINFPSGSLPAPLVAVTTYYVRNPTTGPTTFQVATTVAGTPIDLTTAGSGILAARPIGHSDSVRITPRVTNDPERAVSVDAGTDVITLTAHGLTAGLPVLIFGATMPGGLTAGTAYFPRDVTANTFKLAATAGGAAIDLTSAGTGVVLSQGRTTQITAKSSLHIADASQNHYDADGDVFVRFLSANAPELDAPEITGDQQGNTAVADLLATLDARGTIRDSTTLGTAPAGLISSTVDTNTVAHTTPSGALTSIIPTTATPQITKLTLDAGAATDTQHDFSQGLVPKWREELQASGRFRWYDITNSREILRFSTAGQIRMGMNVNGFGNFRVDPDTAWAAQTAGGAQYRMLYVGDSGYSGATAGTRGDAVNAAGPNDGAFSTFSPYFSGHVNWDSVGSFTSFGSSIHVKRPTHYSSKSIASWADQGGSFQATVTAHGYSNGDTVLISSVTGTTTPNGSRVISNVTANTFTIPVTYATGAITGKAAKATTGPAYSEANAFNGYTFLSSKGGYANCGEWLMAVNSTTEGWTDAGYKTVAQEPAFANAGPAQGVGWFNIFKEYNSYSAYNDAAIFNAESWRTGGARNIWLQSTGTRRIGTGLMMTSSQDVQKDDGTDLAAGVSAWVRAMVLRSADATPRDIFCLDGESRMGFGVTTDHATTLGHRITVGYTNLGVASTVEADGFCLGGDIKLFRIGTGFLKLKDASFDINTAATTFSAAAGAVSGVYLSSAGRIDLTRSNSTQEVLRVYGTPADANPTLKTIGSGAMSWGPGGGTAPDTTLSRTAAGELSINGSPIGTSAGFISSLGAETDPASIDHTVTSGVLTSIIPTTAKPQVTSLGVGVAGPAGGIAVLSSALGQSTTAGMFLDTVTSPGRMSMNQASNGVYIQMFSTSTTNVGARARFHQNNTTKQVNLAFSDGGTGDDGGGAGQGTAFVTIGKVLGAPTLICSNNFEVTSGLVTSTLSVSGASTLTGLLTVSAGIFVPGGSDRSIVFGENTSAPGATASQAKVYADDSGGVTRLRSRFGSNDRVLMRDVAQPAAIASPTGGAVADTQARAAIDLIRQALIDNGHTA